jgi:excisionase family DNA binding protein
VRAVLNLLKTPCYRCKHFLGAKAGRCNAFPDQIPGPIWSGKFQHTEPYPGDRGVRFEVNLATEFLTISELAKILKVNPKTIYRAVWSKKLPAYKIGKALRIEKKDIELFKK